MLSLQALVFNSEPFYNEAGSDKFRGTPYGLLKSKEYNEQAFVYVLQHILGQLRHECLCSAVACHIRHVLVTKKTQILSKATALSESETVSEGMRLSIQSLLPRLRDALNGIVGALV